jgi:hypothetical protein
MMARYSGYMVKVGTLPSYLSSFQLMLFHSRRGQDHPDVCDTSSNQWFVRDIDASAARLSLRT